MSCPRPLSRLPQPRPPATPEPASMHYLFRPIKHLYPIREWALERGAQMRIAPETYEMSLQLGERKVVLFPRFVTEEQGRIVYQRDMSADGNFIGWMPYLSLIHI